jgi:hypothetical protein
MWRVVVLPFTRSNAISKDTDVIQEIISNCGALIGMKHIEQLLLCIKTLRILTAFKMGGTYVSSMWLDCNTWS